MDLGSTTTLSTPFSFSLQVKAAEDPAQDWYFFSASGGNNINEYSRFLINTDNDVGAGTRYPDLTTAQSPGSPGVWSSASRGGLWTQIAFVCNNSTSRTVYWIDGTNSDPDAGNDGGLYYKRYFHIGGQVRNMASFGPGCVGYVARVAFWEGYALTAANVTALAAGTDPSTIGTGATNRWYWPLNGSNLQNALNPGTNDMSVVGTVPSDADDPFPFSPGQVNTVGTYTA
jgi:hypothetical protein